ncbi:hypothetical protein [Streptomyces sp. NPDC050600]|uniref:hypothetical protein n=1 Tax=Streptomyces sp. NPDC050600 TaxID=3157213 RepID=UPI0034381966
MDAPRDGQLPASGLVELLQGPSPGRLRVPQAGGQFRSAPVRPAALGFGAQPGRNGSVVGAHQSLALAEGLRHLLLGRLQVRGQGGLGGRHVLKVVDQALQHRQ